MQTFAFVDEGAAPQMMPQVQLPFAMPAQHFTTPSTEAFCAPSDSLRCGTAFWLALHVTWQE